MKIIRERTQIPQSQKPWTTCVSEAQGAPWKGMKMTQKQEEKE